MILTALLTAILLLSPTGAAARHHFGRVVLMGKSILVFDDTRLLFHAGMRAGDFFDKLERRMTAEGERFFADSRPVSNYPDTVEVSLFANEWTLGEIPEYTDEKRCTGVARTVMESLEIKAEWKTGLALRPVARMTVRRLRRSEMVATALSGYELAISSKGVPLTDRLVVSVYGPDSSLIARFSGAP